MRILVIHQYYLMPGMSGGSRFNEFARLWSEAGHDVTVIAGTVDYGTGTSPEKYKHRWITEEKNGSVRVLRCYVPSTYSNGYVGRMWAFTGFTLSALTGALLAEKPDIVIATSPPLITSIPGLIAAKLRWGVPWVFEIRDLWPESAITTGVIRGDGILAKILFGLEKIACRYADRINVLTPAFRDNLVERKLADLSQIVFVPNGADLELFSPDRSGRRIDNTLRAELGWGNRTVAMYAGAHGRANAIGQLVETADRLRHRPDILIVSVGDGPERVKWHTEVQRRNLTNIVFLGAQPKSRMPDFVNACDIGLAVLANNPTFKTVYPNKIFDYMACAKPSILAIDGVARQLVCEEARAGLFVEPENSHELAQAIMRLSDDPAERCLLGEQGRAWVTINASREGLSLRYLDILSSLVAEKHKAPFKHLQGARRGSAVTTLASIISP